MSVEFEFSIPDTTLMMLIVIRGFGIKIWENSYLIQYTDECQVKYFSFTYASGQSDTFPKNMS